MEFLRTLSTYESFFTKTNMPLFSFCTLEGAITPQLLTEAFNLLGDRHPLLSCKIVEEQSKYVYVKKFAVVDKVQVFENINTDEKYQQLLESIINTPMCFDESLIVVHAIYDNTVADINKHSKVKLIVGLSHVIVDGLANVALYNELLELLDTLVAGNTPKVELTNEIPKAIDERVPLDLQNPDREAVYESIANKFALKDSEALPLQQPQASPKFSMLKVEVDAETFSKTRAQAKKSGCTIHGFICASHLLAVSKKISQSNDPLNLICSSPVNVRALLSPPLSEHVMICAATPFNDNVEVQPDNDVWELAKQLTARSKEYLSHQDQILKQVLVHDLVVERKLIQPNSPTAVFASNLGVVQLPSSFPHIKLCDIHFNIAMPLPTFHLVCLTWQDKLILNYMYAKPWLSQELVEEIAQQNLENLCV